MLQILDTRVGVIGSAKMKGVTSSVKIGRSDPVRLSFARTCFVVGILIGRCVSCAWLIPRFIPRISQCDLRLVNLEYVGRVDAGGEFIIPSYTHYILYVIQAVV
ncbi:hypothetical protein OUZ56_001501 [Daphnia magna]|uniref:Uncharacterized protein n=1 Tax=Daphnia magna TaxID=35525 RepID=A0ABR0A2X6_9CRUS|nr:hypothetical protein OUZ56_001501 [Daphnia magna]